MFNVFKKTILLAAFLGLAVWAGCGKGNGSQTNLPPKLGDLNLTRIVPKAEATQIINKMHGKKLEVTDNVIAYYGGRLSKNILYVSVYENAAKAKADLMNMAMKMAKGSSVFSPLTYSGMGESAHFETQGMGHRHYFYRIDNILVWWQVEPGRAEATYRDLRAYDFAPLNAAVEDSE